MKTHIVKLTPGTITKEGDFHIQHNKPQASPTGAKVRRDVYRCVPDAQLVRACGTSVRLFGSPIRTAKKQGILVCDDIGENKWLSINPEFLDAFRDYWLPRVAGFNPNKAGRNALTYPSEYEGETRKNSYTKPVSNAVVNKSRGVTIEDINALINEFSRAKPSKQKKRYR